MVNRNVSRLARIAKRGQAAWAAVIAEMEPSLQGYLLKRYSLDENERDRLLSDIRMQQLYKLTKYDESRPYTPYYWIIVKSAVADYFRQLKRDRSNESLPSNDSEALATTPYDTTWFESDVHDAKNQLTEQDQRMAELYWWEDCTLNEVAEAFNLSRTTAYRKLINIQEILSTLLKAPATTGNC